MSDDVTPGRDLPTHPDYRFSLANERTFLAYVRTALALDAAALAVEQFLTDVGPAWLRQSVALLMLLAGGVVSVWSYLRWQHSQRAIEAGSPLPATVLPLVIALGTSLVAVGAVLLVVLG